MPTVIGNFLEEMRETQTRRVAEAKDATPLDMLQAKISELPPPKSLAAAIRTKPLNIIAEIKLASPNDGDIAPDCDPVDVARQYLGYDATAISVVTEPSHFKGNLDFIRQIRQKYSEALILRKDFIIDPYQLDETRAAGADAVLLIMALANKVMPSLLKRSAELGLSTIVEVHNNTQLKAALDYGAEIIGVNNRDLNTQKISLKTSKDLICRKSSSKLFISESGLDNPVDVKHLKQMGFNGFLIGAHFMKSENPGLALHELQKAIHR